MLLLACGVSLFTAFIMVISATVRMETTVRDFTEGNVAHETRLMAQQVKGAYDELENDAFVISRTPPIEGIIRSKKNSGIDPLEGSTAKQWNSRLETIFSSIMEERPNYTQIRYIGVADGGRELVRVNRTEEGIERVPLASLQQKDQEHYFQRARTLKRDEAYFSEVNYNREFGQVQGHLLPTIRVVVPVFDMHDSLYGMIIINADYGKILKGYFEQLNVGRDVVIANEAGDYMRRFADGSVSKFYFHDAENYSFPKFLSRPDDSIKEEWVSTNSEALAYSVRLPIKRGLDDSHNVITIRVPQKDLAASVRKTLFEGLLLSGILVILVIGVTVYWTTKMTMPLSNMTRTIDAAMRGGTELILPIEQKDEVGKLAIAFQQLIDSRIEHDALFSAIIDNVVDAIISIDPYGNVLSYNRASETLFGYTADEVISKNVKLLMPQEIADAHDGFLSTYRETNEKHIIGKTRELKARRKDGTFFPMELSVSRVDLSGGSYVFTGIVRDITERKQVAVMQNEFVSTVNHELRTPLTSIRASLGILQRRIAGNVDEKSEHLVNISLQGCERLSQLVNDILDLEKIAAGKMDFHAEVCDIGKLTEEVVERHQSLAEIHNIHFDLHVGPKEHYCRVDPSRFNQALVNLLSNAAKFSPVDGSVKIDLATCGADSVVISVTDEGPGVPEAFRKKIFQRFAQADGSATRAKGGSGLGLNITKSIIEAFDGTIDFESEEGEGATFIITLPICAGPEQQEKILCKMA
ncbi:MAG: PAS domain S-box protein [Parasphingorhabdus sp.]|uniref:PAS domain S-box protein n=1 Tax=Parasphingorhabdus sp. TaxID=2709688 RepID=UPI003001F62A